MRAGRSPHGFEEFYDSIDVVVIGRKTFEVVLKFGSWFYGKKPVFVLSSRPLDLSSVKGGVVEQMSGGPAEIVRQLKSRGFKHAYIDGGVTIQRFLAAGCIDRLVITRVPVLQVFRCLARYRATSVFVTWLRAPIKAAWCRVNTKLAPRHRYNEAHAC
jgi:dihydrofolate reductase